MEKDHSRRRCVKDPFLTLYADKIAHIIREPSKSFAKSTCALQAERRWAVTGTSTLSGRRSLVISSVFACAGELLHCYILDAQDLNNNRYAHSKSPHGSFQLVQVPAVLAFR